MTTAEFHNQHDDVGPEVGATQAGHAAVDQRHAAEHAEPSGHGGHEDHAAHGGSTGHGGHGGHGDHVGQFRRLFWIMLVLAVPVIGFSGMFSMLLGYTLPDRRLGRLDLAAARHRHVRVGRAAVPDRRCRRAPPPAARDDAAHRAWPSPWPSSPPGAPASASSHHELDFWWELALLIVIMLLGHWIEMRSLAQTTSALDSLAALLPDQAERVVGDDTELVAPTDLRLGDLVVVRPGGRVPADGTIRAGSASMDESMITGESKPVRRGEGDTVVAGTVATDSGLRVEITAVGDDTALAGIQRLVSEAQNSSSRAQRIADRAAALLFWFALVAGIITAIVWTVLGLPDQAVVRTITVLVIACPHALGLAIPLVVAIATERAARGGVLVKDRLALESMRTVDTVLFDKTGTLTKGQPTVTAIQTAAGHTDDEVLALAASAETDSEHPLARAIVAAAEHRGLQLQPGERLHLLTGGRGDRHRQRTTGAGRRTEPAAAARGR